MAVKVPKGPIAETQYLSARRLRVSGDHSATYLDALDYTPDPSGRIWGLCPKRQSAIVPTEFATLVPTSA